MTYPVFNQTMAECEAIKGNCRLCFYRLTYGISRHKPRYLADTNNPTQTCKVWDYIQKRRQRNA